MTTSKTRFTSFVIVLVDISLTRNFLQLIQSCYCFDLRYICFDLVHLLFRLSAKGRQGQLCSLSTKSCLDFQVDLIMLSYIAQSILDHANVVFFVWFFFCLFCFLEILLAWANNFYAFILLEWCRCLILNFLLFSIYIVGMVMFHRAFCKRCSSLE